MRSAFLRSVSAHASLMLAIVVDYFRRQQSGETKYILYVAGALLLAIPLLFFARQPKAFFFLDRDSSAHNAKPGIVIRALVWLFVVGFPVAWIMLVSSLPELLGSDFGARFVGSYSAFFWCAATAVLAPYMFGDRRVR